LKSAQCAWKYITYLRNLAHAIYRYAIPGGSWSPLRRQPFAAAKICRQTQVDR